MGWLSSNADEFIKPTAHKIATKYRGRWCAVSFSQQSVTLSKITHCVQHCSKGTAHGVCTAPAFDGRRAPRQGGDLHVGEPGAALEGAGHL